MLLLDLSCHIWASVLISYYLAIHLQPLQSLLTPLIHYLFQHLFMVMSLSLRESSIIFILGSQEEEICTPMFTAELFTIAKTWKQPKCPATDE